MELAGLEPATSCMPCKPDGRRRDAPGLFDRALERCVAHDGPAGFREMYPSRTHDRGVPEIRTGLPTQRGTPMQIFSLVRTRSERAQVLRAC
jgi:hypothetical protein